MSGPANKKGGGITRDCIGANTMPQAPDHEDELLSAVLRQVLCFPGAPPRALTDGCDVLLGPGAGRVLRLSAVVAGKAARAQALLARAWDAAAAAPGTAT